MSTGIKRIHIHTHTKISTSRKKITISLQLNSTIQFTDEAYTKTLLESNEW